MKYYVVSTNKHRAIELWTKIRNGRISEKLSFDSIVTADKRRQRLETMYPKSKFRIYEFLSQDV